MAWTAFKCPTCFIEWADADLTQQEVDEAIEAEEIDVDKYGNFIVKCEDCL